MEKEKINRTKKIIGTIVNVLLWLFVAFAIIVTVVAVSAGTNKKNVPTIGNKCYMTVLSESMQSKEKPSWVTDDMPGGFNKWDIVVGEYIADNGGAIKALKVGDIISFEYDVTGDGVIEAGELNTHRIKQIVYNEATGGIDYFVTQGDNEFNQSTGQTEQVYANRIVAKYTGRRIAGMGKLLYDFKKPAVFWCVIILPLAAFFVYELVVFIRTVLKIKNEGKKVITAEDEELIRQRAVEEYIKRQKEAASASDEGKPSDEAGDRE